MVKFILPWPPSVNTYWRRNGSRYFVSTKGVKYRDDVCIIVQSYRNKFLQTDRLSVTIEAYPPDKRRRDLDNILKSLLDCLQHAEVYHDDCQIDKLFIERKPERNDQVIVSINII